jgi:Homing endonuclease associated repeat
VKAAGLVPGEFPSRRRRGYSSQEVIAEIARVLRLPNSKLTTTFFAEHSRMSKPVYLRRFGSWSNALEATAEALDPDRDGGLLSRIRAYTAGEVPVEHSTVYGDFLHFRGLEHAPVNEQGVIFLFGMIGRELGYVVEVLKLGFPDCVAKRQLRPGIWERVQIEFEFRARTFRAHGHDPDQCDVIVCWENNWPDCPIEVQELKSALSRLSP